ncbi:IS66 family insertion sequence element accessory protein TnpB, partial [Salmonella enterica]|nr:IS66 family insertion sequence element accessory protein TnpB [Salmonella enterica]
HADAPPPVTNEPVTLFLPGGIRMCCQPSQLTDVFRALKYAQA